MKLLENFNTVLGGSSEKIKHVRSMPSDLSNLIDEALTQEENSSLTVLSILSEHGRTLLEIISNLIDEKDRLVLPHLQTLVTNIMALIRTNFLSQESASTLLMNITQYSYTKKAWRKEVIDYLFDFRFFQTTRKSLTAWKSIFFNLMNFEKNSFRDIFSRLNVNNATNIFIAPKEMENEQRSMFIKRFAFILYSSDKDQHQRSLNEILLFLTDHFKSSVNNLIQAQIFFFSRILLVRFSDRHLLSIWPTFFTELVNILQQIEQELLVFNQQSSFSGNTLNIYLSACKFLDALFSLSPFYFH